MKPRHFLGLLAALAVGFGLPYLEVWYACRRPVSEGCVWGQALISVNIAATLVILGIPAFLLVVWFCKSRERNSGNLHP